MKKIALCNAMGAIAISCQGECYNGNLIQRCQYAFCSIGDRAIQLSFGDQ
jgi:hypothetical protein